MIYACCNEHRRAAVLENPALNGIDYLEVLDREAPAGSPRQQTLLVHCLKPVPTSLTPANVFITGGESITGITAAWVAPASNPPPPPQALTTEAAYFTSLPDAANTLVVRTSVAGDFSPYRLRLVNQAEEAAQDPFTITEALTGFDPLLTEVEFSFKVECGPNFDCAPAVPDCPSALPAPPPINYLAKDYGSFRTVLLDRLNQLLPTWTGTSEADIGVMLAEVLAYVGDQLSYQQDAVATEAYLLTARSRVSLRRHALLVDYPVHDGCNARVWVCVTVSAPGTLKHTVTRFYTTAPGMPTNLVGNEAAALQAGVIAFQPMNDANLFVEHNQMQFYTWGDTDCCLPRGATEATLLNTYPNLQVGDVLIFQEMLGPQTGAAADADLRHRCAVRLTAVTTTDGQGNLLVDPLFELGTGAPIVSAAQQPTPVTEIRWSAADALPFPVCISSTFRDKSGTLHTLSQVSAVFGNVVLADQGLTMPTAVLPDVPEPRLRIPPAAGDGCNPAAPAWLPVRYWPRLAEGPVTQAVPLPLAGSPVTPNAVALVTQGAIVLSDGDGFTALTVTAKDPSDWPQYFGIRVTPNAATSGNIDLAVLFCPGGNAPPGMSAAVVLELFTDLSLTPGSADFVTTRINGTSEFVFVPAGYTPPMPTPTTFPAAPTMLSATGPVVLEDASLSHTPYLTLQATNPLSWPPLFGVLVQGDISNPDQFNLVVVYQPPDGGVGVQLPAVAEQFTGVLLDTAETQVNVPSSPITVQSFEGQPNPTLSASQLMSYDAAKAVPSISLASTFEGNPPVPWSAVRNLLASGPLDTAFVVEVDTDGTAHLRFGDSTNGLFPASGTTFTATYRVGNGAAGNVGADTLTQFTPVAGVTSCVNPLPASGGVDPETADQIRRRAPQAFLTQERAVTMTDYDNVTKASPQVEDAATALRWTGSWYTAFITAEPASGGTLTTAQRTSLTRCVNRYRLAGQDIKIEGPDYVSLEIKLAVCVDPSYFQSDVRQSLLAVLGSGTLPSGQPAFFAPGRFVLGQTVYLSPIYQAARSVAGVLTVTAEEFQPQGTHTRAYLHRGAIPIGPAQVARMDNDPSLPDHGQLTLDMQGGK